MRVSHAFSRGQRRRLRLGLPTVLGLATRGFFIPCRHADAVEEPAGYPALAPLFAAAEPRFIAVLAMIEQCHEVLKAIGEEPPPQPRWRQTWFPRLDGAAAYTLVRRHRPRCIVEVGCGHSTRFFARAIADAGLTTTLVAIDPAPRANLAALPAALLRQPVQRVDPAVFETLAAGDILAIDSSHVLMPGSDVDFLLNQVLPGLPGGVLVHVHDVFLPDSYPPAWRWRGYNEQLAVGTLLQGGGWTLLWSSHYVASRMTESLRGHVVETLERPADAAESSLWLEKRDPAYGAFAGGDATATSAGTKNK